MSWNDVDPATRELAHQVLTPRQLDVIRHRANGHPWARIATALNLDEATVRGHHKRAVRKLANARKDAA